MVSVRVPYEHRRESAMSALLSITAMKPDDYDLVLALWRNTKGVGLAQSDSRDSVIGFLNRNPGLSLVALQGQEIIAAVLCGHDGRRGYLYHLAVAEEHRGKGLGKALVETCLSKLSQAGILKATIFVYSENAAGQQFWQRVGWKDRADLVVLQKILANTWNHHVHKPTD
jgi:ribosomal protein S18 acetylase RimI-like enzyme